MTCSSKHFLEEIAKYWAVPIYQSDPTQLHFLVSSSQDLQLFCAKLSELTYYLVTIAANDERELEYHCFKIYYIFSHPTENLFVTLELSLKQGQHTYPSIADIFPAAQLFEDEIADLFGLFSESGSGNLQHILRLHGGYPEGFYPLRRDSPDQAFQNQPMDVPAVLTFPSILADPDSLSQEGIYMPVGPIHAGVIEPGNFLFHLEGETIEGLQIRLGYTHKGIERLFQRKYRLFNGWQLAEKVSGEMSFAHNLAYCKAVESLLQAHPADEANLLRAVFLELERLYNHIGDCSALIHDLALEVIVADLSVLREQLMALNQELTGSRFLRGINKPGGITLPKPLQKQWILEVVRRVVDSFLDAARNILLRPDFRERTINVGVLSKKAALRLGITGLAARASGVMRDFRLQHPFAPYDEDEIQSLLRSAFEQIDLSLYSTDVMGDVFARFVQRVVEVELARKLVEKFLGWWRDTSITEFCVPFNLSGSNYEIGFGYAEGWRGDVVYWIMKDKFDGIFRCKVRDPSALNWAGLQQAVALTLEPRDKSNQTALVDFPVINKSFNLSYTGVDL